METPLTRRKALGYLGGALALPLVRLRAGASLSSAPDVVGELSKYPHPDLGNLHSVMNWVRREQEPSMSFLDERWSSLDEWKGEARAFFNDRLSFDVAPARTEAATLKREERNGFAVETLRLRVSSAYDIPAKLLIPQRRKGRLPAVVALHCHSGRFIWGHEKVLSSEDDSAALTEFRNKVYGRPYTEELARRGYVVIIIDAFYFGARRLRLETLDASHVVREAREDFAKAKNSPVGSEAWLNASNAVCRMYEHLTAKTLTAAGASWPGLLAWDDRRSVDYLARRPEVDPDRIGCVGLSLGGMRAAHLIGSDPRIKAASITGFMTEFGEQLRNHLRHHTWMGFVPGLYSSLDLPDVAALLAPGALLVQQCRRDSLFPMSGMDASVKKLSEIYAKAGLAERFHSSFYDVSHSYRPEMQDESFNWFDRWL